MSRLDLRVFLSITLRYIVYCILYIVRIEEASITRSKLKKLSKLNRPTLLFKFSLCQFQIHSTILIKRVSKPGYLDQLASCNRFLDLLGLIHIGASFTSKRSFKYKFYWLLSFARRLRVLSRNWCIYIYFVNILHKIIQLFVYISASALSIYKCNHSLLMDNVQWSYREGIRV